MHLINVLLYAQTPGHYLFGKVKLGIVSRSFWNKVHGTFYNCSTCSTVYSGLFQWSLRTVINRKRWI
jgi:hypothetical protein